MKVKYDFNVEQEVENIINWLKKYFINNGDSSTRAILGMSGGKDSTVAAALIGKAIGKERVIGVMMPQNGQADIDDARKACELYCGKSIEVDIGPACDALYKTIDEEEYPDSTCSIQDHSMVSTNTPARIRMTTLYALGAIYKARVVNTCNWSEEYVGWSTKYGDNAGDFTVLGNYTVTEILAIGEYLGVPNELLYKAPADGMCGLTDEDKLGFSYKVLDNYIRKDELPNYETLRLIRERYRASFHKRQAVTLPGIHPKIYSTDN